MPESRLNVTAEELEHGVKTFVKKAEVVLEYESLREERNALIEKMEKQTRFLIRLSWLGIALSFVIGALWVALD
jgi:hypothetical protein